jgi:hypothetical protein
MRGQAEDTIIFCMISVQPYSAHCGGALYIVSCFDFFSPSSLKFSVKLYFCFTGYAHDK